MGAQGSSILLLRSAPAPRGNAAMGRYDTFALLLSAADCPNNNGLTVHGTQSQWTTKFDNKHEDIDFDILRDNGWGPSHGTCSAGCGSAGCVNNFCAALGVA